MFSRTKALTEREAHQTDRREIAWRMEWPLVGLLLAFVAICCFCQSLQKPFWYDELVTMRIAALPTLGAIFRFHESGMDTTSFLPAMLIHGMLHLRGFPEFWIRLPFTAAYLVACLCVWMFARRRYAAGFAAGALLLLPQGYSLYFASEARAYAFVLMGTGIALASWQMANELGRRPRLAVFGVFAGLTIAILFHFFAIFLFVPFAVAEWVQQRQTGRVRWSMWLALVLFPAGISIMLPGMLRARGIYGSTFWAKPVFVDVTNSYTLLLIPIARDFAALVLLIAVALWATKTSNSSAHDKRELSHGFTRPEWVLLAGVTLLPLIAFLGSKVLGVYQPRYVVYFQVGADLLLAGGIAETLRRRTRAAWAFGALMLLLLAIHVRAYVSGARAVLAGAPVYNLATEYKDPWYDIIRDSSLPVVADAPLVFLPIDYYAPQTLKNRLLLLTSYPRSVQQPKSVTTELNMEVFGRKLGYRIEDYDQFAAVHHDFFLVRGTQYLDYAWLSHFLIAESAAHHDVQLTLLWSNDLAEVNQVALYRVHLGADRTPAAALAP